MTPTELRVKIIKLRRWHRWAVLERSRNLPFVWVISFHRSRRAAARACGRRIVRLTSFGNTGLDTWLSPVDSEAVQAAMHERRTER